MFSVVSILFLLDLSYLLFLWVEWCTFIALGCELCCHGNNNRSNSFYREPDKLPITSEFLFGMYINLEGSDILGNFFVT